MLGSSDVGKSTLAYHYVEGYYATLNNTVGAAFMKKTIKLDENRALEFQIWDTAGQERFNAIIPLYYKGAQAAIVTYDITDAENT